MSGEQAKPIQSDDLLASDFDFDLPPELIAQHPIEPRDASRLLVLKRDSELIEHRGITDLPGLLQPGDLLVANNSRVLPARLHGTRAATGGRVELLLLRNLGGEEWRALARPARKLGPGEEIRLVDDDGVAEALVTVVRGEGDGQVVVRVPSDVAARLEQYGEMPLPPYIRERLSDQERYQTTYASVRGSAAAPTAGLHFTPALRDRLQQRGIGWAELTLHVGLDTFRPMQSELVREHQIHTEWCHVPEETAASIAATRRQGGRVIAIGTTAARVLETLGQQWDDSAPRGMTTDTGIFIVPGHDWRLVDGLLTNFHLPKSTLMLLVSALGGREAVLAAYTAAIKQRYRFFSFGDAMLIV
ncbi:MAG TPA: tRNA preQ1(34) S-adenosylmethionine ribosyltransferase-isomerase QueA [Thermomicrobiales bacterium]|jgi:S-adenosylmethionine:tRNA ribosyltransferase-isomerase|nr:tRNA preQ1(34) S-adenosylmethionine ribosyltransferase-isomerase QueA [Thermomicrobiales bacterium]